MKRKSSLKTLFSLLIAGMFLFALAGCTTPPADLIEEETQVPGEQPTAAEAVTPTEAAVSPTEAIVSPTETGVSPTEAGVSPTEAQASPTEGTEATAEIPDTGGNTVQVQLSEYVIDMPTSIPAGHTVFEVTNAGTGEHGFEIEGQGIEEELEHHLQPGESLTLEVDLTEGTYEVYCPVSDHAEEGMRLDLTVTAP